MISKTEQTDENLRQAAATLLLQEGLDPKLVKELLALKHKRYSRKSFDEVVKQTLYSLAAARELLEISLPQQLLKRIDLNSVTQVTSENIGMNLNKLCLDTILAAKRLDGQHCLFMIEHQSSPDILLPVRLTNDKVILWLKLLQQDKSRNKLLPQIESVVLYHGPSPYPYTIQSACDLFIGDQAKEKGYFSDFNLIDLGQKKDEQLVSCKHLSHLFGLLKYGASLIYLGFLVKLKRIIGPGCGISSKEIYPLMTFFYKSLSESTAKHFLEAFQATIGSEPLRRESMNYYQYVQQTGKVEGIEVGKEMMRQEIAQALLKQGVDVSTIVLSTGLSKQKVVALKK